MTLEEKKVIVWRVFKAINNKDLGLMDDLMAASIVMHVNDQESQGWKVNDGFWKTK